MQVTVMEGEGAKQTRKDFDLNSETDYFWKVAASPATSDPIPRAALHSCAHACNMPSRSCAPSCPNDSRLHGTVFGSCAPHAALDSTTPRRPRSARAWCWCCIRILRPLHLSGPLQPQARCFAEFSEVAQIYSYIYI